MRTTAAAPDHLSAYEDYYGLFTHAFSLTPDLRFVYASRSHSHAFEQVTEALKRRDGLIVITGDIGTGKTVLCRTLLETFEARTFLSVILDPRLSVGDLLYQVLTDFGLITGGEPGTRPAHQVDRHQLVSTLQRFLATLIPMGAHAVIMIDEAQHLDPAVLEEIRLLSNFETDEAKLLQIVLVGQPDLDDLLRRPDMRQLSQRIARRVDLHPLSPSEVQDYIERRLFVATGGAHRPHGEPSPEEVQFTAAAVRAIAAISGGIPRAINRVCDQALEIGFEQQMRALDRPVVIAAARRLKLRPPMSLRLPGGPSLRAAAALVVASGALGMWWWTKGVPQIAGPTALVTPIAARATASTPMASDARRTEVAPPPVQAPDAGPAKRLGMPATAKPAAAETTAGYEISVAAFRTAQRAAEVADAIAQRGLPVSTRADPSGAWHRIVVGPLTSSDDAESAQRVLARQGFLGTKISVSMPDGRR